MKRCCGNIYKNARRAAGLTQEQAAEQLYISVRSLAEYEAGRTTPPDDVACRMIDVYGDREYIQALEDMSEQINLRCGDDCYDCDACFQRKLCEAVVAMKSYMEGRVKADEQNATGSNGTA